MADGQIVEQGTHEQLVAQGGHYARMVEVQNVTEHWALNDIEHRSSAELLAEVAFGHASVVG